MRGRLQPCLDCGTPTVGTRCPAHDHDGDRRAARVSVYGYGRAHWQRLRKQRLAVDGYQCQLGLSGCTGQATHVHLNPALEGRHDDATLADCVSACASCSGAIDAPRATPGVGGNENERHPAEPASAQLLKVSAPEFCERRRFFLLRPRRATARPLSAATRFAISGRPKVRLSWQQDRPGS